MKYVLEVRRTRSSVTQGSATVLINGEPIVSYCDQIKLIGSDDEYCGAKGRPTYGENIGGWASILPDSYFVIGMWCHEDTNDRIAKAMRSNSQSNEMEAT